MKDETAPSPHEIESLSFDRLLSLSRFLRQSTRYANYCCFKEVNTDTDKDIFKYPARVDAHMVVVCAEGLIELSCDLAGVTLAAGSIFLYNPGTILRINSLQPSRVYIAIFTKELLFELGIKFGNVPLQHRINSELHSLKLSDEGCREFLTLMRSAEDAIQRDRANQFYHEMVRSSLRTLVYRTLYETNEQFKSDEQTSLLPQQDNNRFRTFMRLLQSHYTREHSIRFYADEMNLSAKYLSLLIKKVSGRLATEWIDDYVILEAKNLIKYSSMSIQEIAYALNFPNQSFFGKYFKRHTGLSPKAYRNQP
ncbi:MAG: AraC family transcriptional regulator [Candidatus Amulumruptor caecigallinarius]|nr:AraC family transcriptional regulator [Candidatus Amulumruptor caecigallinarius]MCM1397485.1 AraC family transcriptional regulator [Candidatus Amulumruptor caecigallinarius]MCM1454387.1 AraC family transcriptional regulator [bacterium]